MLGQLLARVHAEPRDQQSRKRLLQAMIENPSQAGTELEQFLSCRQPNQAGFACCLFGECLDLLSDHHTKADHNRKIWYLSILTNFVKEVCQHYREEFWLVSNQMFDMLNKLIRFSWRVFALSVDLQRGLSEMLLGLFNQNLYRGKCLQTMVAMCECYWNQGVFLYVTEQVFEHYPLLDYRAQLHKLELLGDNQSRVFSETVMLLSKLLQLGAERLPQCTAVLNLALRMSSLEMVYIDFVCILTKSINKLACSNGTLTLVSSAIEVLISQIPTTTPDPAAQVAIIEAILSVFNACSELFLQITEQRLKDLFNIPEAKIRQETLRSLAQAVSIISPQLQSRHDLWFFRWLHLLQNYCETAEKQHRKEIVQCILNIMGCNTAALKRHPVSLKVINGLLKRYPTLGWHCIVKLNREQLLSQQTAEEVNASIRRFQDREIRRALWEVIISKLQTTHYEELFDYDLVNYIGMRSSPNWELDPCRVLDIQINHSSEFEGSEEFEAVMKCAEQSFRV